MDNVRFGRALGFGARSLARTVLQAVDAAQSDPPAKAHGRHTSRPVKPQARAAPAVSVSRPASVRRSGARGPVEGARRFRESALRPFVRLSGVLLLEIAGVFFAIFAMYGASTLWRTRADWHSGSPSHQQFVGGAVVLAVFGYFSVSSFLRARRRERGR